MLAIELLTAARALDLRAPLDARRRAPARCARSSASTVAGAGPDRYLAPEIEAACELVVTGGGVVAAAEGAVGELD